MAWEKTPSRHSTIRRDRLMFGLILAALVFWSAADAASTNGTDAPPASRRGLDSTRNWPPYCASLAGSSGPHFVNCFINFVGVNHHLGWIGSVYANEPRELSELQYLGINHVRDVPKDYDIRDFIDLARHGIKFGGPIGGATQIEMSGNQIHKELAPYDAVEQAVHGSVFMVEGANETNTQNVYWRATPTTNGLPSGPAAALAMQSALYDAVRADPNLADVPVIDASINPCCDPRYHDYGPWMDYLRAEGKLDHVGNIGNFHVYTSSGPSYLGFEGGVKWARIAAPGQPVFITEFGYVTPKWISETKEAYYMLDGIMNAYALGVQMLFIYELMDGNTAGGDSMGLFHSDGTPKPAATSIHNMMMILAATENAGAVSTTRPVPTVDGLSSTGRSLALINGIGGYDILIWDEGAGSDATINLGADYPVAKLYDPVQSPAPFATLRDARQTTAKIGADPIILTVGNR
jgi:hypothetical protein